jgi:hypothetical protein
MFSAVAWLGDTLLQSARGSGLSPPGNGRATR